jgi:hypothetical protein
MKHRTIAVAGLGVLLAAVASIDFLRNPDLFLANPVAIDDAKVLERYYNGLGSGEVFYYATSGRYQAVVPQLVAYLSVNALDVRHVPAAFAGTSLLLVAIAHWMFALPAFRAWFPETSTRVVVAVAIALLPAGSFALTSSSVFQGWTCLLIAVPLALLPPPDRTASRMALCSLLGLCIWSGPTGSVLLPLFAAKAAIAWRRGARDETTWAVSLGSICAAYLFLGVDPAGWRRVADSGTASGGGLVRLVSAGLDTLVYTFDRVVFEASFGYRARIALIERDLYALCPAIGALLAAVVGWQAARARWQRPEDRGVVIGLAYCIFGIGAIAFLGRDIPDITRFERAFRYGYVQRYLWLLLVVFAFEPRVRAWVSRRGLRAGVAAAAGLLGWLGVLSATNLAPYRTELVSPNVARETARGRMRPVEDLAGGGPEMAAFLEAVRGTERSLEAGENRILALQRPLYTLQLRVRPRK